MMSADPDISTRYLSTRYLRIATRHHRSWARQIGVSLDGHVVLFALVGADGRDLGQVLMADDSGVELEPAVLLADGLHLVHEVADGASVETMRF